MTFCILWTCFMQLAGNGRGDSWGKDCATTSKRNERFETSAELHLTCHPTFGCLRRYSSLRIFNFWTHTSGVFGPLHKSRSSLPCRINSSFDILGALRRNFSRDSDSDSKLMPLNMLPR